MRNREHLSEEALSWNMGTGPDNTKINEFHVAITRPLGIEQAIVQGQDLKQTLTTMQEQTSRQMETTGQRQSTTREPSTVQEQAAMEGQNPRNKWATKEGQISIKKQYSMHVETTEKQ